MGYYTLGSAILLMSGQIVTAQTAVDVPVEVVVTGRARDAVALERETAAFVRRIAAVPIEGQYARWNAPVCPKIVGLDDRHGGIVMAKIRSIADRAGVAMAEGRSGPILPWRSWPMRRR